MRTHALRLSWIGVVGAALLAPAAWSADSSSDAQARYRQERAECVNGHSHQDRATCLKEAGAALNEARTGKLDDRRTDYERNALMRCQALPAQDREACRARMNGQGTTEGSVEQGAILREYREIVPADRVQ